MCNRLGTNNGYLDTFLISTALNGQFKWVKNLSTTGYIDIISYDYSADAIYYTGYFNNQFTYDSIQTFTSTSTHNCFVLKIDDNGNYVAGFTLPPFSR